MTTPLEEQDERMKQQGFHPDKDYPYPKITKEEYESLKRLRDIASNENAVENFFSELKNFLDELKKADLIYEIERVYKRNKEKTRVFARSARRKAGVEEILNYPEDELFHKLDLILEYQGVIDFIATDGGEIREGTSYEADGTTLKEGWKRFYWK